MRTDEEGNPCPGTLGEYLQMCEALGVDGNKAVQFLQKKIEEQGKDMEVIAPDSQMRMLLMPMLSQKA
jgi:hypothetical protein